jgi:hypothetical protein
VGPLAAIVPTRARGEGFFRELSADTVDPHTSEVVRWGAGERMAGGTCTSGPRGARRGIVGRERAAGLGRTLRFSPVKSSHSFSFMFLFSVLIHIYFESILNLNEFHLVTNYKSYNPNVGIFFSYFSLNTICFASLF